MSTLRVGCPKCGSDEIYAMALVAYPVTLDGRRIIFDGPGEIEDGCAYTCYGCGHRIGDFTLPDHTNAEAETLLRPAP